MSSGNRICATTSLAAVIVLGLTFAPPPSARAVEPDIPCASGVPSVDGPRFTQEQGDYRRRLHSLATGAGVKVAIIDTGVSPHDQLQNLHPGADFVTAQEPDPLRDCDMHGTIAAGIIAGRDIGIAPHAELYSIRQTSTHYRRSEPVSTENPAEGALEEATDGAVAAMSGNLDTLAAAILDAVQAQARVINISVVSCLPAEQAERLDSSVLDSALSAAEEAGTVVVAAAGNASTGGCSQGDTVYPAHSDTVLAVGAVQDAHSLADYSIRSEGPGLSADGHPPLVLNPAGGWATAKRANGTETQFHGTSFAAPVVSATVALLAQRYPHETAAQLRARVTQAAQPVHGFSDPLAALTHLPAQYSVSTREMTLEHDPASPSQVPNRLGIIAMLTLGLGILVAAWLGFRR